MLLEFPKHVLPLGYGWSLLPFKIFFPLCEIVIKNFVIIFDSHVHRAQRISLLMLTPHSWHCLSPPQGLIYFEDLSIGGCNPRAAFGTSEKKKIGLGCFVSGTAVDANEITLFRDFQDVSGKEMPELSRDGCSSQSWCGRSCPVCSCARGCSTLSLRQVISLICVIYLLLLCYFIIFLDSFKLITAATWHVIKANNSWDYACLSGLVFETQIVLFTLFLLAQTCAFLADRWLHR